MVGEAWCGGSLSVRVWVELLTSQQTRKYKAHSRNVFKAYPLVTHR